MQRVVWHLGERRSALRKPFTRLTVSDARCAGRAHSRKNCDRRAGGSAGLLPALGDTVPDWENCVTIQVDDDEQGEKAAHELQHRLAARGIAVDLLPGKARS